MLRMSDTAGILVDAPRRAGCVESHPLPLEQLS
jgi:hypothetical protein